MLTGPAFPDGSVFSYVNIFYIRFRPAAGHIITQDRKYIRFKSLILKKTGTNIGTGLFVS